ncbi:MAG: hypothetical protein IIW60_01215 [Alistipes sp.]|nr:hypothetical protein [Alistipes sp.]
MLKLLHILLFVFCYSVADALSLPQTRQDVECGYVVASNDSIRASQPFQERNYDESQGVMLMPRTALRYVVETASVSAASPALRYSRVSSSSKTLSAAIPSRHVGRITKIFEFNHFRSALRIVYYLHSLCRLRI